MGKLTINRGTTYTIGVVYKRNGVATTLVGATVRFTVKPTEYDEDMDDSDALIIKNITDGNSSGEATITIDPEDTAEITPRKYFYDIKVEQANGEIYKIDEGTIKLDGSPTNRGA
jgi:hypothetical protein